MVIMVAVSLQVQISMFIQCFVLVANYVEISSSSNSSSSGYVVD